MTAVCKLHDAGISHDHLGGGNEHHIIYNSSSNQAYIVDFTEATPHQECVPTGVPTQLVPSYPRPESLCSDLSEVGNVLGYWNRPRARAQGKSYGRLEYPGVVLTVHQRTPSDTIEPIGIGIHVGVRVLATNSAWFNLRSSECLHHVWLQASSRPGPEPPASILSRGSDCEG